MYAHRVRQLGVQGRAVDVLVVEALFSTVTNVDFGAQRLQAPLVRAVQLRDKAREGSEQTVWRDVHRYERVSKNVIRTEDRDMKVKWLVLSITAVLTVGLSTAVWADCDETPVPLRLGQGYGARQGDSQGWMAQLSEEQREQIKTEVGEMREQGASSQEVRDAMRKMLKDWGVDEPARGGQGGGMGGYGPMMGGRGGGMGGYGAGPGWMSQLTPAQRQQIQATIRDMLKNWGIEPPQQGRGYGPMRGGRGGGMQGQGYGE